MSTTLIEILVIFVLIVLNGFFSMSEIAVVSARKVRLEQRAEEGDTGARHALELLGHTGKFLSAVQIGITLIALLTGAFGGATLAERLTEVLAGVPWLASIASSLALIIVVLITTYFSLVIGELIPKKSPSTTRKNRLQCIRGDALHIKNHSAPYRSPISFNGSGRPFVGNETIQ